MPDLINQPFYHCLSAENFVTEVEGSKGKKYTVRYDQYSHKNRRETQCDYSCNCDAYKFGKGAHCKHIEQVIKSGKHCNWMQYIDGGKPVATANELVCPKCGGPISSMLWAV
jgi:hypothetical protein